MTKPSEWVDERAIKLAQVHCNSVRTLAGIQCIKREDLNLYQIMAILEFLDENMAQRDCDTCLSFKPNAPGAVVGTCPHLKEQVTATFGCKKHSRS